MIDAELDRRGIEGPRPLGCYGWEEGRRHTYLGYDSPNDIWKMRQRMTMRDTTADRLLCALGIPEAWHTDPELADLYQQMLKLEA